MLEKDLTWSYGKCESDPWNYEKKKKTQQNKKCNLRHQTEITELCQMKWNWNHCFCVSENNDKKKIDLLMKKGWTVNHGGDWLMISLIENINH